MRERIVGACAVCLIFLSVGSYAATIQERATKESGLKWPYLFYVPKSLPKTLKCKIMVIPSNTGHHDSVAKHRKKALKELR